MIVCIGGPLHNSKVMNCGLWFKVNENGEKEYSTSTIKNAEYADKYVLSSVYPTMESKEYISMYIWENDQNHIKEYFFGQ